MAEEIRFRPPPPPSGEETVATASALAAEAVEEGLARGRCLGLGPPDGVVALGVACAGELGLVVGRTRGGGGIDDQLAGQVALLGCRPEEVEDVGIARLDVRQLANDFGQLQAAGEFAVVEAGPDGYPADLDPLVAVGRV